MHDCMKKKTNEDHDNAQPRESGTDAVKCASVNAKLEAEVTSMCIVAVWVGHNSSSKMVKTYAMLDNCSQGSFIKEEIIEGLGITGRKLKLSLKKLTGEKSEELAAVNGLVFKSFLKSSLWKNNNNSRLIQVFIKIFFDDAFQACLCLLSSHV